MPKLKPIHLYFALGLIILIVGVVLKTLAPTPSEPKPLPTLPPGISNSNPNFQIKGELSNLPESNSVTEFTVDPGSQDSIPGSLSRMFAAESPQKIEYPNGQTKYTWKIADSELNYYPDRGYLTYFNPSVLTSQQPLPSNLINQADAFIQNHLPLSPSVKYKLIQTTYLKSNESVAKQVFSPVQANLIQFEYRYLLDDKPLYFGEYGAADIIITLNADGVRNFKTKIPPHLVSTDSQQNISPSSQINQLLISGQYTIVKVNNQQYYEGGPLFNVATMTIDSTRLGYLINGGEIYPVYIISGQASHADNPKVTYSIELAVNALNP